jgi:leucyl-tRNA synthetase
MEAAHSFRLTQKKAMSAKGAQKPTNGVIWVAKTFPPWQSCVLDTMRALYEVIMLNSLVHKNPLN